MNMMKQRVRRQQWAEGLVKMALPIRASSKTVGAREANTLQLVQQVGRFLCGVALTAALVGAAGKASAQVNLDQFRPAERAKDGFAISRPNDQGHLKFGVQLFGDYANDPLVYEQAGVENSIVQHHLVGHLTLSLGLFDRLVIFAGTPMNIILESDDPAPAGFEADGFGIGDPWAGLRLRLLGGNDDIGSVAVQGTASAPLADEVYDDTNYGGENGWTVHPELLGELRPGGVKLVANVGARIRPVDETVGNVPFRDDLTFGAGVIVPIVQGDFELNGHAEIYGSTPFEDFGDREVTPLEAIGGLKAHTGGWAFGAAAGPGINAGVGTPDVRVIAMLGYMGEDEEVAEPTNNDSDGDGLLDNRDQCPNDPEDADEFEDSDGCPDPDNDQDGVLDVNDGAPLDPEDKDGFEDEDGVPDPDNDGDKIEDGSDKCPNEAEDVDGFEDEDGCPDADNDGDGVPDAEDECPMTPGVAEAKGCPKNVRLDAESGQILILQEVNFLTGQSDVSPERPKRKAEDVRVHNEKILNDVQAIVMSNPQVKRVRVEGHTDARGGAKFNMNLSKKRAQSVVGWLVSHGVDSSRLVAYGCGEDVANPKSQEVGLSKQQQYELNRRTEFHIIDPAPKGGIRDVTGCEPVDPSQVQAPASNSGADIQGPATKRTSSRPKKLNSARGAASTSE